MVGDDDSDECMYCCQVFVYVTVEPNKKITPLTLLPMARKEHDRPDPSLIVEGTRRSHPSKRIQGNDYPITPSEELRVRSKGTYSPCLMICTF
jgi:hypothetical protein